MRKLTLIALTLLMAGSTALAQDFSFSAQFRERSEFDAKRIMPGQSMDVFHLLRTRFSANAAVNEDVTVFLELQDARTMGAEGTLLNTGAPSFDVRQAFVNVENVGGSIFDVKLGRQVMAYANERLIGAFDWSNYGRSFDAGVVSANFENFRLDVLAAAVNRNPANPYIRDAFLAGLWAVWNPSGDMNSVQPFFLYDNPVDGGMGSRVRRYTAGVYTNWMFGGLDATVEGAYQFGEFPNVTLPDDNTLALAAYMVGLRVGYTFKEAANFRIGAGLDMLSGNAAPDEGQPDETIEAFSPLYPTNHKFYGHMDYFTGFANASNNRGLMDIIVQLSVMPRETWRAGLDFHMLNTAVDPADFNENTTQESSIGMELDLWTSFEVANAVWTTVGFSIFDGAEDDKLPDTGISPGLHPLMVKTTKWGWIQVMVNI